MAQENDDELLDDDSSGGSDSGETDEGQEKDEKGQDLSALQAEIKKLTETNKGLIRDLTTHKTELAEIREHNRRVGSAIAGVEPKTPEERDADKVRGAFLKLFPGLKKVVESQEKADTNQNRSPEPSLGEKRFYSDALERAAAKINGYGVTSREGQEALSMLGELFILKTPAWKTRFYEQGDMRVVDEVHDFLDKKMLQPFAKQVEQKVIARLRKQGVIVGNTGQDRKPAQKPILGEDKKPLNLRDPANRLSAMESLAEKYMGRSD